MFVRNASRFSLLAGIAAAAACGSSGSVPLKERPVVRRAAFDPREKPVPSGFTLLRLDDASHPPEFSADTPPAPSADRTFDFRGSAEEWTFNGGGAPAAHDGLAWDVGAGKVGIVSPALNVPFRELRAIEVILSASAGQRMRLWWSHNDAFEDERYSLGTEIETGPTATRYVVKTATLNGYDGLLLKRLRLDPTDGEPGSVRVLGIRLIGREGSYAARGHGIAQESLTNQVRNVLFHRVPSRITWTVTVPAQARLEVGSGLLDAGHGVTFSAEIEAAGRKRELFRTRVTDDDAWHDSSADLGAWAGRTVRLTLSAQSDTPGRLVLWSNPLIASGASRGTTERPNVLVYVVDTLRSDHLGTYGDPQPTSPTMDRLGSDGVVFERCSSAGAWTRPSVASLLTSLAPPSHGVTKAGLAMPDGVVTLAEQMRQAGYVTAGFITSSHAGGSANLQQGYDFLFETPAVVGDVEMMIQGRSKDFSKKNSVFVNKALFGWIDRYADQPLFLYLHAIDPHAPYAPPPPYDRMFTTGYIGPIDGSHDPTHGFEAARTPEELGHVRSLYDGDIRYNDDRIGELVEGFRRRGLLDRTLLVLTSDHGEEFLEHGGFEHGRSLHGELIDVPLIMRLPGVIPAGRRMHARVSALDVMPTILDIVGLPANPDVQGQSLLPALSAASEVERDIYSWRRTRKGEDEVALVRGTVKGIWSISGKVRLFDRATDPREDNDLSKSRRAEASAFAEAARAWLQSRPRIASDSGSGRITVDAREREWLGALGYIQ